MEKKYYAPRMAEPQNLLFGVRPIIEAIEAGKEIDRVFLKKGLDDHTLDEIEPLLQARKIPFQYVPIEKLNKLTRKNHQGMVAFASLIEYADLQEVLTCTIESGKVPLILLLDEITDVRNFGAIARSAECFGVHAIVVPEKGAVPINGDALKTSAGALNLIPVCRVSNMRSAIYLLRDNGVQIVAASEKGTETIYNANLDSPTAIVMGSEDVGVSPDILKLSDKVVKIPIVGSIASLNVSAATAVVLYETGRQRNL